MRRILRRALAIGMVAAGLACGQSLRVEAPSRTVQGSTMHVRLNSASTSGWTAIFGGLTIPVFQEGPQVSLALVPVPATQEPGRYPLEIRDAAGAVQHSTEVTVQDARFPIQNIRASKQMSALEPMPGEMERIRELQSLVSPERFWWEPFGRPVPTCMNSPFGVQRYHNGKPTGNYHRGIDQRGANGAPVKAVANGRVEIATMFRLHGGTVGLDHGQGVTSIYIHLSRFTVQPGSMVRQGDVIGYVGATGFATGPHLHWGLYVHGVPVNPVEWVPAIIPCR